MKRALIACEESQAVCKAFRGKGVEAFSCDLQAPSGGRPEWHIQGDVLDVLDDGWDLIIAHPPCTYLAKSGSCNMYLDDGQLNAERYEKMQEAREFFMKIYNANCPHICIENPVPFRLTGLPAYSQIIQPYDFGADYSKQTCLWLKGLPYLLPQCIVLGRRKRLNYPSWVQVHRSPKVRSKTFPEVAEAMAAQWCGRI